MQRVTVITPRLSLPRYLADLRAYGELLYFLAGRDLSVRYKQTVAGVLWAFLVPLLTVGALSFVFGRVAGLEGSSFLSVYAAMIPWQLFTFGLQTGGTSLLGNIPLVTKLYFPRMIIPISSLWVAFVDLALNLLLLLAAIPLAGGAWGFRLFTLPIWVLLGAYATLGPMLVVAALLVRYRDLRFLLPFAVQFGMFITPVGYAMAVVPEAFRAVFMLNPLVGVIEGMRWAVLPEMVFPLQALLWCMVISTLFFFLGVALFLRSETSMADEI